MVSKDDQLTVFINTAYLGSVDGKEVRGFAEASRVYFKKSFKELTETEYLSIVAMLIAPKTFNIKNHTERNLERVEFIKKLLKGDYVPTENSDMFYGQKI
jgi:membrane peptidoglycan carboxypeptidase